MTWIRADSVRLLLPLIGALGFLAPVASATTINFETLSDGSTPVEFSEVGSSYSTLGVTIGTLEANDFVVPKFRELAGPGVPPSLWVTDFGSDRSVGFHILDGIRNPALPLSNRIKTPSLFPRRPCASQSSRGPSKFARQ